MRQAAARRIGNHAQGRKRQAVPGGHTRRNVGFHIDGERTGAFEQGRFLNRGSSQHIAAEQRALFRARDRAGDVRGPGLINRIGAILRDDFRRCDNAARPDVRHQAAGDAGQRCPYRLALYALAQKQRCQEKREQRRDEGEPDRLGERQPREPPEEGQHDNGDGGRAHRVEPESRRSGKRTRPAQPGGAGNHRGKHAAPQHRVVDADGEDHDLHPGVHRRQKQDAERAYQHRDQGRNCAGRAR